MCLWHFPSLIQLKNAIESENLCVVLTLQGESEEKLDVHNMCNTLGIYHITFNWWKFFRRGRIECLELSKHLAQLMNLSQNILIHCAAGVHRTGTCAYLFLRCMGLDSFAALDFIQSLRPRTRDRCGQSLFDQTELFFQKKKGDIFHINVMKPLLDSTIVDDLHEKQTILTVIIERWKDSEKKAFEEEDRRYAETLNQMGI